MYTATTSFKKTKIFRFKNLWLKSEEFINFMNQVWITLPPVVTPTQLHNKLEKVKSEITKWTRARIGNVKRQIGVCRDFIGWLDKVEERRISTQLERKTKALVKRRYTTLAVYEEELWKQRAKTKWDLDGDNNTAYFHAYATSSQRQKIVGEIEHNGRMHKDQQSKAQIFREFYINLMGKEEEGFQNIDWQQLYPIQHDLANIATPITQEEIAQVIQE
ncbi:uncharacterized protein LOC144559559 [Carex rostrata]